MSTWLPCPFAADYRFDADQVRAQWAALHAVDANGTRLDSKGDRAWLAQPEARRTRQATLTRTVQDLIWHDRGVWRIVDRSAWGVATTFEWIAPSRISTVPNAPWPMSSAIW